MDHDSCVSLFANKLFLNILLRYSSYDVNKVQPCEIACITTFRPLSWCLIFRVVIFGVSAILLSIVKDILFLSDLLGNYTALCSFCERTNK